MEFLLKIINSKGSKILQIIAVLRLMLPLYVVIRQGIFLMMKNSPKKYGPVFQNVYAVVTGGTDGIGYAYVNFLGSLGYNLIIIGRNPEKLQEVADEMHDKHPKIIIKTIVHDFSKELDLNAVEKKMLTELKDIPDIGILVNNVGVYSLDFTFFKADPKKQQEIIDINILSTIYMSKIITQHFMIPRALRNCKSAIINISSRWGLVAVPGTALYSPSKAFVIGFGAKFRMDIPPKARRLIHVLTLTCGAVATKMWGKDPKNENTRIPFFMIRARTAPKNHLSFLGLKKVSTGNVFHFLELFLMKHCPFYLESHRKERIKKRIDLSIEQDIIN